MVTEFEFRKVSGRFPEGFPEEVRKMVTEFEFRKVPEGFRKAGPEDFYRFNMFCSSVSFCLLFC